MATELDEGILKNIQNYAAELHQLREQRMETDESPQGDLETQLQNTVNDLQDRLRRQQAELEKLRQAATTPIPKAPSSDPHERLKQLLTIKAAYEELTLMKPDLPSPTSLIPALLAARIISQTTRATKSAINRNQDALASMSRQVEHEESSVRDLALLKSKLESRISRLRTQQSQQRAQSPAERAKQLIQSKQVRIRAFDNETERLRETLNEFIQSDLATMIAAEELGGPMAGEDISIDDSMLDVGFSASGKPAPRKANAQYGRQRRIDETLETATDDGGGSEKDAAVAEVRELVERLLATMAGEGEGSGYINLNWDSAAARFLVRAKVAAFHPKDARRLRLVDFGRDLEG